VNVLDHGVVELIDHMGNDNTIVNAARVSYLGNSKGEDSDRKLIRYLLENSHSSPFEQVEFQFIVKCPIIVVRQWHRHRTWSYNEVSRRYTSEDISFHIPFSLRKQSEKNRQSSYNSLDEDFEKKTWDYIEEIKSHAASDYNLYMRMIESGVAREQARMVLPQNMYTSYYAKTDLHNLFHFIKLRNSDHAQYEIKVYAEAIEKLIQPIVPVAFEEWKKLNP